jgi:hypothetical protein
MTTATEGIFSPIRIGTMSLGHRLVVPPHSRGAGALLGTEERTNGGLCLDCWHHFRGANDDGMLRAIPAERIFTVQFDDGPRQRVDPDYYTDCTRHREVPGDGDFDLTGFLRLVAGMGVRLPLSVEVMSTKLQDRTAGEITRRLAGRRHARSRHGSRKEAALSVADELAIRALVARYADAVCRRDPAAWAATWAQDCRWDLGGGRVTSGRSETLNLYLTAVAKYDWVGQVVTTGRVEVDGDSATGWWYLIEFNQRAQGDGTLHLGHYDDEYVRTPDGWRFASRTMHMIYRGAMDRGTVVPLPPRGAGPQA